MADPRYYTKPSPPTPFSPPTPPPLPHFAPNLGNPHVPHSVPQHYLAYVDKLPTSSMDKYEIIQLVSSGSFGSIFEVREKENGKRWALKKKIREPKKYITNAERREIHALSTIGKHINVIEMIDIVGEKGMLSPVMDLCCTDLGVAIFHFGRMLVSRKQKVSMIKMMLTGLSAIHEKKITHCDLKPSNILVNSEGVIKIADFGSAIQKDLDAQKNTQIVTLAYRAPELLMGDVNFNELIDVWSAGVIVLEMWLRSYMIRGCNEMQVLREIFHYCGFPTVQEWPEMRTLPEFPNVDEIRYHHLKCSNAAIHYRKILGNDDVDGVGVEFLLRCLQLNPKKRNSAKQLLMHPFLQGAEDNVKGLMENRFMRRFC